MKSFIEYSAQCEFSIENLPYGVFSTADNVSQFFVFIFRCYLALLDIILWVT